ncbi:MAG TPA: BON domain-containing protein [Novosphingobium sp.]
MNDRSRWSRQPQQGQNWSGQQGGWHDEPDPRDARRGDWDGGQWRGSRDWGDTTPQPNQWQANQWHDRPFRESPGTDRGEFRRSSAYGQRQAHWGPAGPQDEGRGGAGRWAGPGDYGEGYQRDDSFRAGSQSFAAGYGMADGPNYDRYAERPGSWAAPGSSNPTFGRGYGPDYVGASQQRHGLIERISDAIAGWFGGDEDEGRRQADWYENHRGRGPGDYVRADERIREDVNDRLTDDHRLDARRISVRVTKGEVTLDGSVPNRASKRRAEDLAEAISGVRHVQNNLRIDALGDARPGTIGTAGASGDQTV